MSVGTCTSVRPPLPADAKTSNAVVMEMHTEVAIMKTLKTP